MIYGNKLVFVILFLSFFFFVGCTSEKNYYFELYDGYEIRNIDGEVKLYKDEEILKIQDLNYKIDSFKYNSDVVCIKLTNGKYYMIYYFDTSVYGPFTSIESLDKATNDLSMEFLNDFVNVKTAEGKVYE